MLLGYPLSPVSKRNVARDGRVTPWPCTPCLWESVDLGPFAEKGRVSDALFAAVVAKAAGTLEFMCVRVKFEGDDDKLPVEIAPDAPKKMFLGHTIQAVGL